MRYTETLDIAVASSARRSKWQNKRVDWGDLVRTLQDTERTPETLKQYFSYTKDKQDAIKDVGGFVGGYLVGGVRRNGSVQHRQLVCLDVDYGGVEVWEAFKVLDVAGCMYSTHKHRPEAPRLRIIFPLDRKVSADEYEAIARVVASWLDIDKFDDTTYQPTRLMYYPSTPKDGEYLYDYQDAPFMCADDALAELTNWEDPTTWPTSSRVRDAVKTARASKVEDPTDKDGIIGAFCRAYGMHDALAEFLPEVYEPCPELGNDRYTFVGGSTSGGLVVYDDKLAYSHHSTDVAGGKTCNAFDLVRLHKFGDLDDGREVKDPTRVPSFKAMADFASKLKEVKREVLAHRRDAVDDYDDYEDEARERANADEWLEELETEKNGTPKSTIANVVLVLQNDDALRGAYGFNEFEQRETAVKPLPWDKKGERYPRPLADSDDAQLRLYLERAYGIIHRGSIADGLTVVLRGNSYHPIKDYLDALEWDGGERLDELFINVLGAPDTAYTRAVTRKAFTAAVARIYRPGVKFDYVTTIIGEQGIGKSSTLARMGGAWFSDSVTNVEGKEALESIQGSWIIELGEMAGLRKAEVEKVKAFVSKTEDRFRVAYGKRLEHFPRRCVFFATSNEDDPLRDATGNRRFWIVNTKGGEPFVDFKEYLDDETVAQLWAEAKHRYEEGEALYLDSEKLERQARIIQDNHLEKDERLGLVGEYLARALPKNWEALDPYQRRSWLEVEDNVGTVERSRVCLLEIWAECLGKDPNNITRKDSFELGRMLKSLRGWTSTGKPHRFKWYGSQKAFILVNKV